MAVHTLRTRALPLLALTLLVLLGSSCGRPEPAAPAESAAPETGNTFSVMTYNLDRYGFADRDGDGQALEAKPDDARAAIANLIAEAQPDVLALQEMGNAEDFTAFQASLRQRGLDYPFAERLQQTDSDRHLAVLSRFPLTAVTRHTNNLFSIGDVSLPVRRGYLEVDVSVNIDYSFRLINAHLKAKVYHPLGQTEMRRNEARLLNNHIRRALAQNPRRNLLVVGDLSDHVGSAAVRTVTGNKQEYVTDLALADEYGEAWTFYNADDDSYVLARRPASPGRPRLDTPTAAGRLPSA
jgi:endonuclease/exonuclease/phosphatase family metal-dependent hydrolase